MKINSGKEKQNIKSIQSLNKRRRAEQIAENGVELKQKKAKTRVSKLVGPTPRYLSAQIKESSLFHLHKLTSYHNENPLTYFLAHSTHAPRVT